eukprot:TRINITY_DN18393_c0_g2_i1.p1 TRINITY_DN18393_c0_g2~~TRINITY_DN18393_c0_g2_i1.p1  ORF type:complete len:533 (-),score=121.76 TRINITY_DN18393_c0_g2_i1:287-1885(-)
MAAAAVASSSSAMRQKPPHASASASSQSSASSQRPGKQEPKLPELENIELRWVGNEPAPIRIPPEVRAEAEAVLAERGKRRAIALIGEVLHVGGCHFAVTSCMPRAWSGVVCNRTLVYFGAQPVPLLERVQFACLDPRVGDDESKLFDNFVYPYLMHLQETPDPEEKARTGAASSTVYVAVAKNTVLKIAGRSFGVVAMDPDGGVCAMDDGTQVFVRKERTIVLEKICAKPYRNTLPAAYSFELFEDMLKPYFQANPFKLYREGDEIEFQGVCCKVLATQPAKAAGRVSEKTLVYCDGPALPPRRTTEVEVHRMLDDEMRDEVSTLPEDLQRLFYTTVANQLHALSGEEERQQALSRGRGLTYSQIIQVVKQVRLREVLADADAAQQNCTQCMVCLNAFVEDEAELLWRLPCRHVFHKPCVQEWLQRSPHCPLCKSDPLAGTRGTGGPGPAGGASRRAGAGARADGNNGSSGRTARSTGERAASGGGYAGASAGRAQAASVTSATTPPPGSSAAAAGNARTGGRDDVSEPFA